MLRELCRCRAIQLSEAFVVQVLEVCTRCNRYNRDRDRDRDSDLDKNHDDDREHDRLNSRFNDRIRSGRRIVSWVTICNISWIFRISDKFTHCYNSGLVDFVGRS